MSFIEDTSLTYYSWVTAESAILTQGVVKSATLPTSPMAFNIENIGKKYFCSFFSKYVISKSLHFFPKYCPGGDGLLGKKNWDTPLFKTQKNGGENFLC